MPWPKATAVLAQFKADAAASGNATRVADANSGFWVSTFVAKAYKTDKPLVMLATEVWTGATRGNYRQFRVMRPNVGTARQFGLSDMKARATPQRGGGGGREACASPPAAPRRVSRARVPPGVVGGIARLQDNYKPIAADKAKELWQFWYDHAKHTCNHGYKAGHCKVVGAECRRARARARAGTAPPVPPGPVVAPATARTPARPLITPTHTHPHSPPCPA